MTTATTLRALLVIAIILMAGLALFFLSRRRLTLRQVCGWGLLAVLIPMLGPFLVILFHPGEWYPSPPSLSAGQTGRLKRYPAESDRRAHLRRWRG